MRFLHLVLLNLVFLVLFVKLSTCTVEGFSKLSHSNVEIPIIPFSNIANITLNFITIFKPATAVTTVSVAELTYLRTIEETTYSCAQGDVATTCTVTITLQQDINSDPHQCHYDGTYEITVNTDTTFISTVTLEGTDNVCIAKPIGAASFEIPKTQYLMGETIDYQIFVMSADSSPIVRRLALCTAAVNAVDCMSNEIMPGKVLLWAPELDVALITSPFVENMIDIHIITFSLQLRFSTGIQLDTYRTVVDLDFEPTSANLLTAGIGLLRSAIHRLSNERSKRLSLQSNEIQISHDGSVRAVNNRLPIVLELVGLVLCCVVVPAGFVVLMWRMKWHRLSTHTTMQASA